MEHPIRILLVDDHSLFRSGIRFLLSRHPEFEVVGEAADGLEGIKRAKELKHDIVLLDLHMPGITGICKSSSTISGLSSFARLMPSRPSAASPTTSNSG